MMKTKALPGEKERNVWVPMPLPALVPLLDLDDLIKTKIVSINIDETCVEMVFTPEKGDEDE
jgi:hypothetical protein